MAQIPGKVPAHKATYREVEYRADPNPKSQYAADNDAKWYLYQRRFFDTSVRSNGRFVILLPQQLYDQDQATNPADRWDKWIGDQLADQMRVTGLQITDPKQAGTRSIPYDPQSRNQFETFKGCFEEAKKFSPGLVILVNDGKAPLVYNQFKRVADQTHGMHTLCVVKDKLDQAYKAPKPYFGNIAMKVNIKLGNVNHTVQLRGAGNSGPVSPVLYNRRGDIDTILLGADVTHAQKESKDTTRSLAALVGSVDETFGRFGGSVRYQTQNQEVSTAKALQVVVLTCFQIIDEIDIMTEQRLEHFYKVQRRLPVKILYYRDGVDPGYVCVRSKLLLANTHPDNTPKSAAANFARSALPTQRALPSSRLQLSSPRSPPFSSPNATEPASSLCSRLQPTPARIRTVSKAPASIRASHIQTTSTSSCSRKFQALELLVQHTTSSSRMPSALLPSNSRI